MAELTFDEHMGSVLALVDRDELLAAYELVRELADESKRWTPKQRKKYETIGGFLLRILGGRGEWPPRDGTDDDDAPADTANSTVADSLFDESDEGFFDSAPRNDALTPPA